jgi:hypothetical protein
MDELTYFGVTIECELGEQLFYFSGVATSMEQAQERAMEALHDSEYIDCVQYRLVGTHYTIL